MIDGQIKNHEYLGSGKLREIIPGKIVTGTMESQYMGIIELNILIAN
jgi:hypothetical protein